MVSRALAGFGAGLGAQRSPCLPNKRLTVPFSMAKADWKAYSLLNNFNILLLSSLILCEVDLPVRSSLEHLWKNAL